MSAPHRCNTPAPAPPSRSAHCTTSPHHTNSPSAPDDWPPCPSPHCQSYNHAPLPRSTPRPITPWSPHTCPCKTRSHKPCARTLTQELSLVERVPHRERTRRNQDHASRERHIRRGRMVHAGRPSQALVVQEQIRTGRQDQVGEQQPIRPAGGRRRVLNLILRPSRRRRPPTVHEASLRKPGRGPGATQPIEALTQ